MNKKFVYQVGNNKKVKKNMLVRRFNPRDLQYFNHSVTVLQCTFKRHTHLVHQTSHYSPFSFLSWKRHGVSPRWVSGCNWSSPPQREAEFIWNVRETQGLQSPTTCAP